MDVFNQRLEQEYGAQVVLTCPNVPIQGKLDLLLLYGILSLSNIICRCLTVVQVIGSTEIQ
jgi:hypothetical protein